jgi:hypothetical protein
LVAALISSGLAWAFINYSTDYNALENAPRAKHIGKRQSKTRQALGDRDKARDRI